MSWHGSFSSSDGAELEFNEGCWFRESEDGGVGFS